jgi:hypothetical protein
LRDPIAAAPHPFAAVVTLIAVLERLLLRKWRDVVLPRYHQLAPTPAYRAARLALANALDAIGYRVARDLIVRRAGEVAQSIAWLTWQAPGSDVLWADAARRALTAAPLAVWARV